MKGWHNHSAAHSLAARGIRIKSKALTSEQTPTTDVNTSLINIDKKELVRPLSLSKLRSMMGIIEDRLASVSIDERDYEDQFEKGIESYWEGKENETPNPKSELMRKRLESIYLSTKYTNESNWKKIDFHDDGYLTALYVDYAFGDKKAYKEGSLSKEDMMELAEMFMKFFNDRNDFDKESMKLKNIVMDLSVVDLDSDVWDRSGEVLELISSGKIVPKPKPKPKKKEAKK